MYIYVYDYSELELLYYTVISMLYQFNVYQSVCATLRCHIPCVRTELNRPDVISVDLSIRYVYCMFHYIGTLFSAVCAVSYAPKNTNPPILIHATRGCTPLNNFFTPPVRYTSCITLIID